MVKLVVGPDKEEFVVHKEFACYHSPVLKAAFNSTFIEGQTQTYTLEEVIAPVARLLVNWLYTQQLDLLQPEDYSQKTKEDLELARLFVIADKLLIPQLQNAIIVLFHKALAAGKDQPVSCVKYIWENTTKENPLRRLILHYCVFYFNPIWLSKNHQQFPKEFLIEALEILGTNKELPKLGKALGISNVNQYKVPED